MTSSAPQTLRIMDLALRAGEMLLSNGAGTADVSATMSSIARHLGLRGTYVDVTHIMLTMVHDQQLDEPPLILRRNVVRRETDFEDVTAVDRLVSDLLNDEIDLDEARSRLAAIATSGHARPRWVVIGGAGLVGAGVAMMLGGDARRHRDIPAREAHREPLHDRGLSHAGFTSQDRVVLPAPHEDVDNLPESPRRGRSPDRSRLCARAPSD